VRRRLFTLASAMSLLLCVATVVLWARSYSRIDAVQGSLGHERVFAAYSDVGEIDLCFVRYLNYQIPRKDAQFKAGSFARDFNGMTHSARLWPSEALDVSDFMQSKTWSYHEGEVRVFNDPQITPTYKTLRIWMRFRTACAVL
jgi:hypothetical protein